jgi:hypothetical protein
MITKQLTRLILVCALLLTANACGITKHKQNAEKGVVKFHEQLNAEQYHEIYVQSDKLFQQSATEADIVALLGAVHAKLGTVKNATVQGWHVNATPSGTFVTLGYDVEFSEGKGMEQFVFKMNGSEPLLFNYNVNSPLLITK